MQEEQVHAYQQLLVLKFPLQSTKITVYAKERVSIPPGGWAKLKALLFDQVYKGDIIHDDLALGLKVSLLICLDSHVYGELAPWKVHNITTTFISIKAAA